MPAEGEQLLGFYLLDRDLERRAFVFLLGLGDVRVDLRGDDGSAHDGAGRERAVELHAEPGSEFRGIGDRAPYPFPGSAQKNLLFDAVCAHATSWLQISGGG